MTITTITVTDPSLPIEVQDWFDLHPDVVVKQMFMQNNIFYVVY